MTDITKYLLTKKFIEIYKSGGKRAYLLSLINELGGTASREIDYDIAKKVLKDDIYIDYSINLDYPTKDQFIKPYKIIQKVIDKLGNIILICEEQKSISLE